MNPSYIYILTNQNHNVFYTGVTTALSKRIYQHKNHFYRGFTYKYNVTKLVYCQKIFDVNDAILMEKRLKKWRREWKIQLINKTNPEWKDLYVEFADPE